MIRCSCLKKKDTDAIFKIAIREFKEAGKYNSIKHVVQGKENFFLRMTEVSGNKYLFGEYVDVFWQYFSSLSIDNIVSSYITIKIFDSEEFRNIVANRLLELKRYDNYCKARIEVNNRANSVINDESGYALYKDYFEERVGHLERKQIIELYDILKKHKFMTHLGDIEKYLKNHYNDEKMCFL